MRTWFLKLRISATLDEGKSPSPALRQDLAGSPEAERFAETALALDRALKRPPFEPDAPAALHETVMRAVRAANRPADRRKVLVSPGRLAVAGAALCLALLLAGLWRFEFPAPIASRHLAQPLAPSLSAAELGQLVAQSVPPSVVSPLADEFERLGQDLDRTENFLLASLP
jgi:hypothetical protein